MTSHKVCNSRSRSFDLILKKDYLSEPTNVFVLNGNLFLFFNIFFVSIFYFILLFTKALNLT